MKITKTKIAILIILVISVSLTFIIILNSGSEPISSDCIERQSSHKVTLNGSTILAFNSVPKKTVSSLKKYLKNNGYNGKNIDYTFLSSPYTNVSGHPWQDDLYYVAQVKTNSGDIDYKYNRSFIYIGELAIDKDGNVTETQNLLTAEELSNIQTVPTVSFVEAADIAKNYLNEEPPVDIWSWRFCTPRDDDEWVLCFEIKFRESGNTVYIDGFSGEIINVVEERKDEST